MSTENTHISEQLAQNFDKTKEVTLKIGKYLIEAREKLLNAVLTKLINAELNEKIAKQITRVTNRKEPGVEYYYLNYGNKKKEKFLLRFKVEYPLPDPKNYRTVNFYPKIKYSTPVVVEVEID